VDKKMFCVKEIGIYILNQLIHKQTG